MRFQPLLRCLSLCAILFFPLLHVLQAEEEAPPLEAPKQEKKYQLTIGVIFKDEALYFREWIEYHKLLGAEHFFLYNNGSTDNFLEVLDPYIKAHLVTVIDWPNRPIKKEGPDPKKWNWVYSTQITAYEDAINKACKESKWIALIDIDEYIVPVKDNKITDVLARYEQYPGIGLIWQPYGTGDVKEVPKDKLMIEVLNRTDTTDPFYTTHTMKVILKPEEYDKFVWPPHVCEYKNNQAGFKMPVDEMRVNHYMNRTLSYFYNVKIKSKQDMESILLSPQEIADFLKIGNKMEDTERSIHRFVPELRKRMGFSS